MAREVEGYGETLAFLLNKYGRPYLTVSEVGEMAGLKSTRHVSERFYGWSGKGPARRMPAAILARQLCK